MTITLVGEVVNHCDDTGGWKFPKLKDNPGLGGGTPADPFWG